MTLLSLLLGALAWTLLEYALHRWLGHDRRIVHKNPFGLEHTAHHSRGHYFAPAWKKGAAALLVLGSVGPLAVLAVGAPAGIAFTAGLTACYLAYEALHRLLHVWAGVGPYARWARRHHFFHHFHDPQTNHGVTTPLWDWVFGTLRRADVVAVPPKLAMPWLVDPQTGDVHPRHRATYRLRGHAPAR